MVHIERLVQVHLLKKVFPNRHKPLLYLVELSHELLRLFVQLNTLALGSLILNWLFLHDRLIYTDIRDGLIEHAVNFTLNWCSTLIADDCFLLLIFVLGLHFNFSAIEIKWLLVCSLGPHGLALSESFKVCLFFLLFGF